MSSFFLALAAAAAAGGAPDSMYGCLGRRITTRALADDSVKSLKPRALASQIYNNTMVAPTTTTGASQCGWKASLLQDQQLVLSLPAGALQGTPSRTPTLLRCSRLHRYDESLPRSCNASKHLTVPHG